jgi:hypothetical protein
MTEEDGLQITLGELQAEHLGQVLELISELGAALIRAPLVGVHHSFAWPKDVMAGLADRLTELTLMWAANYDETNAQTITIIGDSRSRAVLYCERFR